MALQSVGAALCLRIPDFYCVVIGPAHHLMPVILDAAHCSHMSHQHMQALPGLYIPKTESGIARATHHPAKGREVASASGLAPQETQAGFPDTPLLPQAPLPRVVEVHATHS